MADGKIVNKLKNIKINLVDFIVRLILNNSAVQFIVSTQIITSISQLSLDVEYLNRHICDYCFLIIIFVNSLHNPI